MRRPAWIAVGSATLLVALGLPFLGVRFIGVDATVLPASSSARQAEDVLRSKFAPGLDSPLHLAARSPDVVPLLQRLPNVLAVAPPERLGTHLWAIDVVPRAPAMSTETKLLVREVRQLPGVTVSGKTAWYLDTAASLKHHLPFALALLAITTFVLLFIVTQSVVLPLKALLMNLLGLSAAFGVLVLIFQDGRLEGLLGYKSQGALELTQPVLLFAIAFGLATDYGVFLLSRIKEAHDAGLPNREAVALGLERTGRVVTAAALLFCVAVGAFATSGILIVKELGIGIALAVAIDASLVRALLVPSLMALLGDWNWWTPAPLRRFRR
jgi:RND superfamily putative drug exporter